MKNLFHTHDSLGTPVIIKWYQTSMFSRQFTHDLANLWPIARLTYTRQEIDFLKKFPEAVGVEPFFTSCKPLFKNGTEHVNWQEVSGLMETILEKYFVMDPELIPEALKDKFKDYSLFLITVSDKGNDVQSGFIVFMTSPHYPEGTYKATMFAVEAQAQQQELRRLLMSSLFVIIPTTTRIFLDTRITNESMISECTTWGFTQDHHPQQEAYGSFNTKHWVFMEYLTEKQHLLQTAAQTLTP